MTDSKTLPGSKTLPDTVHAWAESVRGPLTVVRDASHSRPGSRVWEVTHQGDGTGVDTGPGTPAVVDLDCLAALDAASAISWGVPHHDPEIVERGRATLARLERGDAA
ncbi:hypothetical protein [Streptomyces sp. NPDC058086]|uniref:hypothetical protein n=1 Tax=Streptomyces sp. NPDC058086 TaxID=3346334 RepID=UPI0036EF20CA